MRHHSKDTAADTGTVETVWLKYMKTRCIPLMQNIYTDMILRANISSYIPLNALCYGFIHLPECKMPNMANTTCWSVVILGRISGLFQPSSIGRRPFND